MKIGNSNSMPTRKENARRLQREAREQERTNARKRVEELTDREIMCLKHCLREKLASPTVAGKDAESKRWQRHLEEIIESIDDPLGLVNIDWTEVYYAVLDHGCNNTAVKLIDKIGPDGQNMWSD